MNLSAPALTKYCLVAPPLHRVSADVTLNWISSDLGGDFGSTGEIKIWKKYYFSAFVPWVKDIELIIRMGWRGTSFWSEVVQSPEICNECE